MDDDVRVAGAPDAGVALDAPLDGPAAIGTDLDPAVDLDLDLDRATEVGDAGGDGPVPPARPKRVWLRRVGVAVLVLLLLGLAGLQVQAARVQTQTEAAETAQRTAELDEEAARIRLESVGDRVRIARGHEDDAQAELDRARADMTAKGFEESALGSVQASTAKKVTGLQAGVKKVAKDIAEQNRLQPAAAACLFDMLRALGRVDTGARGGQSSEACKTVASSPGPA